MACAAVRDSPLACAAVDLVTDVSAVLASLRQLAEGAPGGDWEADDVYVVRRGDNSDYRWIVEAYDVFMAKYIAACDPPTVLALIAVAEAAEEYASIRRYIESLSDLNAALAGLAAVRGVS